ncbi:hypothetical protein G5B00_08090 [Parapedobacter sp. SGR-10]|uniref:hypothetical protein n=1 Tax=Parapedobacter sp. SGR-10 TaxID=2710879 RepID=UPI0013D3684F|nr:hypothetical protein [Parapedobacter sp. SGR-10]NGF56476.1 hypothetical protein [Parapedobacter sp. SGR-10]
MCRPIVITDRGDTYGIALNMYYNAAGQIQSIIAGEDMRNFSYTGATIIAARRMQGMNVKEIYEMNNSGLPVSLRKEYNASGSNWINYQFAYNGTEITEISITIYSEPARDLKYIYSWENGNLYSLTDRRDTLYFEYDTDKAFQPGDAVYNAMIRGTRESTYIDQMLEMGMPYIRNKNMVRKMTGVYRLLDDNYHTAVTEYEYLFDDKGKVVTVTAQRDNDPAQTTTLQYECN